MAAPARYETANAQLLRLAIEARAEGLTFDEFWERAVRPHRKPIVWRFPPDQRPYGCVVWPNDTADRQTSRGAITDPTTRREWCSAYNGLPPSRAAAAIGLLAPILDELRDLATA